MRVREIQDGSKVTDENKATGEKRRRSGLLSNESKVTEIEDHSDRVHQTVTDYLRKVEPLHLYPVCG